MALVLGVLTAWTTPARAATPSGGAQFVSAQGRLVDTRPTGAWVAGSWHTVRPAGQFGVPASGVTALAVTLTSLGTSSSGYASAAPASGPQSYTTMQLSWDAGDDISNSALVATDGDGSFQLHVTQTTQVIIELQGYFTTTSGTADSGFVPLPNGGTRIFNSVVTGSTTGHLNANQTYTFTGASSSSGVPVGATAVFANISVLTHTANNGTLTPYATGTTKPSISEGFDGGGWTGLGGVVPLSSAGQFNITIGADAVDPVDIAVDVEGYYTNTSGAGGFTPQTARVYDSRAIARIQPNTLTKVQVAGLGGIPSVADGAAAEAINVLALSYNSTDSGYLRLWGTSEAEPTTVSDLTLEPGGRRSNLTTVMPGSDNSIWVRFNRTTSSNTQPIDIVLDVEGWYTSSSTANPPSAPQSVSATASDSTATISFQPPSGDGGAPVTSYSVIASPNGQVTSSTGSPIVMTGLHNGTQYTFTVAATNAAGTGPSSTPSNAVTPMPVTNAPSAPLNVQATPGDTQATVSFSAPSNNGGAPITSYTVTSSPDGKTATGASSPLTVTGLQNNQTYSFTVTATNSAGTGPASMASNKVTPKASGSGSGSNATCAKPSNHCWGVDILPGRTSSDIDSLKSNQGDGSYPDFVGRYITRGVSPAPLDRTEVGVYRNDGISIEMLADKTGGCADTATGNDEADSAAAAAANLGLKSGTPVAIFLDEEPGATETAACNIAYADRLTRDGYQPGFYLSPSANSGSAYCGAISDANVAGAAIFSYEPQLTSYSIDRNNSPNFNPDHPNCGNPAYTFGWQFSLSQNNGTAYDYDEFAPDRTSALWTP